ncbi:MAG: outer-membrane lipoprotein carrier protein LolA [Rhodoblastus sp.]
MRLRIFGAAIAALLLGVSVGSSTVLAQAPAKSVKPQVGAEKIDRDTAIDRANAYLNSAANLVADFVQIGADGRRSEGRLYVRRPGRMRFEYAQPATLEIVADGTSVAIRDRKLATQDMYFISQTPLKFLLKERIDLRRDVKVLGVAENKSGLVISIEDKATFGGTSLIKLIFDPKTFALKQWQVTDPQGYETLVSLFNIDLTQTPESSLFRINNERMLSPN